MSIEASLMARSESCCELCTASAGLTVYSLPPASEMNEATSVLLCATCAEQVEDVQKMNPNHWRCLNDSMWSQIDAVQVLAWRMLTRLRAEGWPQDLLDMLYLDEEKLKWAQADGDGVEATETDSVTHIDSNGVVLAVGDTVTLIKDLNVKGAGFTAKRGVAVRGISLVADNPEHIEGRVNGQQIVILTKFVKKSG